MILGSKKQIANVSLQDPRIYIAGQSIEQVWEARNLGVLMDNRLRFENHVSDVVKKCFYRLKVLYKMRDFLSVELRQMLCESLVLSKLNYCDVVIGPCLLAGSKKLIQRVQNACARYCYKVPARSHVTPFLNTHNCLKMEARNELHFASLLFGVVKKQTPKYLSDKLTWGGRSRASGYLLLFPRYKTAAFRGSFRYLATKCWNNLPPPLRNLNSIASFKNSYRRHLLIQQKSLEQA